MDDTTIDLLIIANLILWLTPPFILKGFNRYYIFILSFIFSQSYWAYIPIHYYFKLNLPTNIIENQFIAVLKYSLIAAISFYSSALFFLKKRKNKSIEFRSLLNPIKQLPKIKGIELLLVSIIVIIDIYSFSTASGQIGISDKTEFMDYIRPFWYTTLVPVNAVLLCVLIIFNFKNIENRITGSTYIVLMLLFFHLLLVGFEGSRRSALPPIMILAASTFFAWASGKSPKLPYLRIVAIILVFMVTTSFLGLNRNFDVGWKMFSVDVAILEYFPDLVTFILAPTSTLHVNTQMAEFIDINGPQGYWYYFYAVGNTLFPRFLFGWYLFGDPLVSVLHERFGWYGQDFGFLAEAIYSGGMIAVVLLHLIYGFVVASVLNGIAKSKIFFLALGVGLLFGALNSLRSDFMNLLKASLYPSIFLYIGIKNSPK